MKNSSHQLNDRLRDLVTKTKHLELLESVLDAFI